MKRIIKFTKLQFMMMGVSLILIVAGAIATFMQGGFNLGIDFAGGLTEQFQVAKVAFSFTFTGPEKTDATILNKALNLTVGENKLSFPFATYKTVNALAEELKKTPNFVVDVKPEFGDASTERLESSGYITTVTGETAFIVNIGLADEKEIYTSIEKMRNLLKPIGRFNIQQIGLPLNQEYILKLFMLEEQAKTTTGGTDQEKIKTFQDKVEKQISEMLSAEYGANTIILKKGDYVGPSFSKEIFQSAFVSIILVFVMILIYVAFRFRIDFGLGGILALVHDVLIMLAVMGTLQLEINYASIAAILTIVGYSINDTIVVYDRIRENMKLMRETDMALIMDTSITQSITRTINTSLTTIIAILFIFIFCTGVIKDFAFNLIVGIISGTYSSIFVAAPIVRLWQHRLDKGKSLKTDDTPEPKEGQETGTLADGTKVERSDEPVLIERLGKKKKKKK